MYQLVSRGGMLMGASEIENLQRALINLSVATQRPAINTKVTGVMDDGTMVALSGAMNLLGEELPNWAYLGLQAVFLGGATSATAKKYAGEYASQLTLACNAAAIKFKVTTPPVVPGGAITTATLTPWYKTPIGVVGIAAGLFVGYKLFLAPKEA